MTFANGKLKKLCPGRKSSFNGYDIATDYVEDENGKQGYYVQVVGVGGFMVVDGVIHECYFPQPPATSDNNPIKIDPKEADLSEPVKQAISKSIAEWQNEASSPHTFS